MFVTGLGASLARSENIHAIYDAYKGEKVFMSAGDRYFMNEVGSGKYSLMVIDIFPVVTPGKAIMIWHAIQGGKYIGLDQKGTYYREEFAKYIDRIVAAGRGGVDMFHRCTGVPKERIVNMGMPRTDRYFRERKERPNPMLERMRKVYLFAPTFRGGGDVQAAEIDWKAADDELEDGELMLVKAHPYGRAFHISGCRHIAEADRMTPTAEFLDSADVVITDYSSIIFDGYLMGKPAVLFEKEQGYVQQRGMYLEYPGQYCSRYATDEKAMVRMAREADGLTETEKACVDYVADMCDGHSCERICRLIEEMNG